MHLGTSGETFGTAGSQSHCRFSPFLSHFLTIGCLILLHLNSLYLSPNFFCISDSLLLILITPCLNYLFPILFFFWFVISFSWFLSPSVSHHLFPCPAFLFHYRISLFLTTPTLANPVHRLSETFLGIVNKCLKHCADMSWC